MGSSTFGYVLGITVLVVFVTLFIVQLAVNSPTQNTPTSIQEAELANYLTSSKEVCERNGTLAPLAGSCIKGTSRASLALNTSGCPTTFTPGVTCSKLNTWNLTQEAVTGPQVLGNRTGALTIAPMVTGIIATATKSSTGTGMLLSSSVHLVLTNGGSCGSSNISSILFLLEQASNSPGSAASYGPGGSNQKLWASSGIENSATSGLCNTPGRAQICTGNDKSACNITVPYISGLVENVDLSQIVIPANANCGSAVVLDLNVDFSVSNANWTLMQAQNSGYRVNVLVTFDACCDRGSACGINIDCSSSGTVETIRTVQVRSPVFTLPSTCTDYCDCIQVNAIQTVIEGPTNTLECGINSVISTPYLFSTICQSKHWDISFQDTCDTRNCNCAGNVNYGESIFSDFRSIGCVNPITGQSLITGSGSLVSHQFECVRPETECVYGEWSPWSQSGICGITCNTNYTRTRALISACHEDPVGICSTPSLLAEQKSGACSTVSQACVVVSSVCRPIITNGFSIPCQPLTCTRPGKPTTTYESSFYCTDGQLTPCLDLTSLCNVNCTVSCAYDDIITVTECFAFQQTIETHRIPKNCTDPLTCPERFGATPKYCDSDTGVQCPSYSGTCVLKQCPNNLTCCGNCPVVPSPVIVASPPAIIPCPPYSGTCLPKLCSNGIICCGVCPPPPPPISVNSLSLPFKGCTYTQGRWGQCSQHRDQAGWEACTLLEAMLQTGLRFGGRADWNNHEYVSQLGSSCASDSLEDISQYMVDGNRPPQFTPIIPAGQGCLDSEFSGVDFLSVLHRQLLSAIINVAYNSTNPALVFDSTLPGCTISNSVTNTTWLALFNGRTVLEMIIAANLMMNDPASPADCSTLALTSPMTVALCEQSLHPTSQTIYSDLNVLLTAYNEAFDNCVESPLKQGACFRLA